jgi:hypothetical protein
MPSRIDRCPMPSSCPTGKGGPSTQQICSRRKQIRSCCKRGGLDYSVPLQDEVLDFVEDFTQPGARTEESKGPKPQMDTDRHRFLRLRTKPPPLERIQVRQRFICVHLCPSVVKQFPLKTTRLGCGSAALGQWWGETPSSLSSPHCTRMARRSLAPPGQCPRCPRLGTARFGFALGVRDVI